MPRNSMQYTNPHLMISTFFGLGHLAGRIAGTIGSLVAFPITLYCFKLSKFLRNFFQLDNPVTDAMAFPIIIVMILFVIGVVSTNKYSHQISNTDPKEVIIDEIVGQMLCIILTIPISLLFYQVHFSEQPLDLWLIGMLLANFILFRIFDIFKPWPINWVERKFKGGFGIMCDDILAAIFAVVTYFFIFLNLIDYLK